MGFNDYLGPLVNVEGATSISTILLVDVDVRSFSTNKYIPTPWAKHTKTTVWGAPSLRNPSCSKLYFPSFPRCHRRPRRRTPLPSQGTSLRSLHLSILDCINPLYDPFPCFSLFSDENSDELHWCALCLFCFLAIFSVARWLFSCCPQARPEPPPSRPCCSARPARGFCSPVQAAAPPRSLIIARLIARRSSITRGENITTFPILQVFHFRSHLYVSRALQHHRLASFFSTYLWVRLPAPRSPFLPSSHGQKSAGVHPPSQESQNQRHKFHLVLARSSVDLYQASCSSIHTLLLIPLPCKHTCMLPTQAPCMHIKFFPTPIHTHTSNPSMHYGRNSWPMVGRRSTLLLPCKPLYLYTLF